MKYFTANSSIKKKVRGIKRKSSAMIKHIVEQTLTFPEEERPDCGYWHLHLPVAQAFIDSSNTPSSIRRLCMQTLIDRVDHLKNIKPESDRKSRVIACINLPNLWDSQIIVFYGDEYFSNFFTRDSPEQKWEELPSNRSMAKELNLTIPMDLTEKGYLEHIQDEDWESHSEIWFIGELM